MRYFLALCLQSVEAAIKDLDAEIIVVDNNSSDESCTMVKQNFPNVKLIENTENLGFSKGNNIGVKHAKGEYLCILNPDTVVPEDCFTALFELSKNKNNLGLFACRLINGTGTFLPESKRYIPIPKVAIKKMLGFTKSYYATDVEEESISVVPILVGAFMIVKTEVYKQVQGLDEDYFMYGEDIDLSYKVIKAGYDNMYYGPIKVIHFKGECTLKDSLYTKRFYDAMLIFYAKHFKANALTKAVISLLINMAKMFKSFTLVRTSPVDRYVLISDKHYPKLEEIFKKPFRIQTKIEAIQANTQVILDANYLSFKQIIACMSASEKNQNITFKILPKNSNFMIGSNSTKNRGEVIHF